MNGKHFNYPIVADHPFGYSGEKTVTGEIFSVSVVNEKKKELMKRFSINNEEADYFVFTGEAINTTYNLDDERINILFKDGSVKDISKVDNALIHQHLSSTVKKQYICYLR